MSSNGGEYESPEGGEEVADDEDGARVGDSLRSIYDEVLAEEIPEELRQLLEQLK